MKIREPNLDKYVGSPIEQITWHFALHNKTSACVCWSCCEIRKKIPKRIYEGADIFSNEDYLEIVLSEEEKEYFLTKIKAYTKRMFRIR
jgi:hypothetical protein